jgi:hypothetical protein
MQELRYIQKLLEVDEQQAATVISVLRSTISRNKMRMVEITEQLKTLMDERRLLEYQTFKLRSLDDIISGNRIRVKPSPEKDLCDCTRKTYQKHDKNCAYLKGKKK